MDWLDFIIILVVAAAIVRGIDLGLIRQLFSAVGFFGGLFLGAALEGKLVQSMQSTNSRAMVSVLIVLGCGLVCLALAELIANMIKHHIKIGFLDRADRWLGAAIAGVTLLGVVWLGASVFSNTPFPTVQQQIRDSAIISKLNSAMPPAPQLIAKLGHLITPNGFPQVFIGAEPTPIRDVPVPDVGEMTAAVARAKDSTVKIEGKGCGGVISGSGFVADTNLVITNAHVVAGVDSPKVVDKAGVHAATVVWFNPDLDLAVLRTSKLAGQPLQLATKTVSDGTQGVVLGYPGGGDFKADPIGIIDAFTAEGKNIYNEEGAVREIYSMNADIISGNSGGPVVDKDGTVIGVVFAHSVTYQHVGYALTMPQVLAEFEQAKMIRSSVPTGSCTQQQ